MQFSRNINGGDERDRTADPLLARQVLSQLSYAPIIKKRPDFRPLTDAAKFAVPHHFLPEKKMIPTVSLR